MQSTATAAVPLPVCNFPPCSNDLVFNFDFTNPPQSLSPPYVSMEILLPVNVIDPGPASINVSLFSGLNGADDASGSGSGFNGGVAHGSQILSFVLVSNGAFDGQLDGIFSIGLHSGGSVETGIELTSSPTAVACRILDPLVGCSTVKIDGVEPLSASEPATFVLLAVAFAGVGLRKLLMPR
jgi:hypothetical protein